MAFFLRKKREKQQQQQQQQQQEQQYQQTQQYQNLQQDGHGGLSSTPSSYSLAESTEAQDFNNNRYRSASHTHLASISSNASTFLQPQPSQQTTQKPKSLARFVSRAKEAFAPASTSGYRDRKTSLNSAAGGSLYDNQLERERSLEQGYGASGAGGAGVIYGGSGGGGNYARYSKSLQSLGNFPNSASSTEFPRLDDRTGLPSSSSGIPGASGGIPIGGGGGERRRATTSSSPKPPPQSLSSSPSSTATGTWLPVQRTPRSSATSQQQQQQQYQQQQLPHPSRYSPHQIQQQQIFEGAGDRGGFGLPESGSSPAQLQNQSYLRRSPGGVGAGPSRQGQGQGLGQGQGGQGQGRKGSLTPGDEEDIAWTEGAGAGTRSPYAAGKSFSRSVDDLAKMSGKLRFPEVLSNKSRKSGDEKRTGAGEPSFGKARSGNNKEGGGAFFPPTPTTPTFSTPTILEPPLQAQGLKRPVSPRPYGSIPGPGQRSVSSPSSQTLLLPSPIPADPTSWTGWILRKADHPFPVAGSTKWASAMFSPRAKSPRLPTPALPTLAFPENVSYPLTPATPAILSAPIPTPSHSYLTPNPNVGEMVTATEMAKGWKPFRCVVKDGKMFLYKPGDLGNMVKATFPTGIVKAEFLEVPLPGALNGPGAGEGKAADPGKGRNAAFGKRHPDLKVRTPGGRSRPLVAGGTVTALAHEVVFDTCSKDSRTGQEEGVEDEEGISESYHEFLRCALLFWPRFGSAMVEGEDGEENGGHPFALHLNGYLASVLHEPRNVDDAQLQRLASLVRTLCESTPEDVLLPHADADVDSRGAQDEEQPLHRPPAFRTVALDIVNLLVRRHGWRDRGKDLREMLEKRHIPSHCAPVVGLGKDDVGDVPSIDDMEAEFLVERLEQFHGRQLRRVGSQVRPRYLIETAAVSLDATTTASLPLSYFSFSPNRPHFLSHFILNNILSADRAREARAKTIERWIQVGEMSRARGDLATWAAVAFAICSGSVLRLQDTWRAVERDSVTLLREVWVPTLLEVDFRNAHGSRISPIRSSEDCIKVPYLGSVLEETVSILAPLKHDEVVDMEPIYDLRDRLASAVESWSSCQHPSNSADSQADERSDAFDVLFERLTKEAQESKPAWMTLSLACEPVIGGSYFDFHYRPVEPDTPSSLWPLLFVDPLPHLSLVDRDQIWDKFWMPAPADVPGENGLKKSGTVRSLNMLEAATLQPPTRLARRASFPPARQKSNFSPVLLRLKEEMGDPNATFLVFAEGDLVLKVTASSNGPSSRPVSLADRTSIHRSSILRSSLDGLTSQRASLIEPASRRVSISLVDGDFGSSTTKKEASNRRSANVEKFSDVIQGLPLSVTVKAGTLDRLCDILVLSASHLRSPVLDDAGTTAMSIGGRPLKLDMDEYRTVFFSMYRSFSTPVILLQYLKKRFIGAPEASAYVLPATAHETARFPTWSPSVPDDDDRRWDQVDRIRLGALTAVQHWIVHHPQDFLDDPELTSVMETFLGDAESYLHVGPAKGSQKSAAMLDDCRSSLRRALVLPALPRETRTSIPKLRPASEALLTDSPAELSTSSLPTPSFDQDSVEDLCNVLEAAGSNVEKQILDADLIALLDNLETFSAGPSSWYAESTIPGARFVVDDIYIRLHKLAQGIQLEKLPAAIRSALQAHAIVKKWFIHQISDPTIDCERRRTRIRKILEVVAICRSRMGLVPMKAIADEEKGSAATIASFTERAALAALVSPESWAFSRAWIGILPDSTSESLEMPLPKLSGLSPTPRAVDLGWLIEKLMEVASEVADMTDGKLINFDKRRFFFNLIRNSRGITDAPSYSGCMSMLGALDTSIPSLDQVFELASRDRSEPNSLDITKLSVQPMSILLDAAQTRARASRNIHGKLLSDQQIQEETRRRRETELNRMMEKPAPAPKIRPRRMTMIFKAVTSHHNTSEKIDVDGDDDTGPVTVLNPAALEEFVLPPKPVSSFPLEGATIGPFRNPHRSFVFELETTDGRYLLQVSRAEDMKAVTSSVQQNAQIRSVADPKKRFPVRASGPTFGCPLQDLVEREASEIPHFVQKCLRAIEKRGLSEEGIYRLSGEVRLVNQLQEAVDRHGAEHVNLDDGDFSDVHTIAGCLKLFLRRLPEPVIPTQFYAGFIQAINTPDQDSRLLIMRALVWSLPENHSILLRVLLPHLAKVASSKATRMEPQGLGVVFAPSLLRPQVGGEAAQFGNIGRAGKIVETLVARADWILAGVEPAAEGATPSGFGDAQDNADAGAGAGADIDGSEETGTQSEEILAEPDSVEDGSVNGWAAAIAEADAAAATRVARPSDKDDLDIPRRRARNRDTAYFG